ncbi:hypothetical protein ACL7TT_01325 [Microbulbifer sp. 2304DJ12-6]|uniref:hypothetical protein n=1 Tax=Microbulbifer sp. 2304DJ12-6 TaxID=3233340 RepID=UPI0039AFE2C4
MREININELDQKLKDMILTPDPVDEDIIVRSEDGKSTLGVFISPEAYEYFLRSVEEEEDRIDAESIEEFHRGEK